nr:MAG TPA: deoxyribosyltransferase [Caudoviricetes sp.]
MAEYRNAEGYADPTAYEAFRSIEKEEKKNKGFMPIVYICSPYAGDIESNTDAARRYCRFAVDKGAVPLAVHLLFPQFMSEDTERDLALHMGEIMLSKCRELWCFGNRISEGMKRELETAGRRGITIRCFTEELEERSNA